MATEAVTAGDLLYARLPAFQRQVEVARRILDEGRTFTAGSRGRADIGVSCSGGKDSLVALHLAREAGIDGPVLFIDSGAEFPETYQTLDLLERLWDLDLCRAEPDQGILDLHRHTGWWDWSANDARSADFRRILFHEPAQFFVQQTGVTGQILGLRQQESNGRAVLLRTRGSVHAVQYMDGLVHLHPLASWSVSDIWAYIALHDLPYNPVYDTLTRLGVPRDQQRVSSWAGTTGNSMGRFAVLKAGWPDLYQRFADAFPRIKEAT